MAPRRQGIAERGKYRDEPWRGRSEVGRQNDLALHLAVLWSQVGGEPSGGRAPQCPRRQGWELGRQSNPYRPIRSRIVCGPAQGAATEPRSSPGGRKVGGRRCWQRHPEKGKGPGSPDDTLRRLFDDGHPVAVRTAEERACQSGWPEGVCSLLKPLVGTSANLLTHDSNRDKKPSPRIPSASRGGPIEFWQTCP